VVRRFLDTLSTATEKWLRIKRRQASGDCSCSRQLSGHMGDNQTYPANHPLTETLAAVVRVEQIITMNLIWLHLSPSSWPHHPHGQHIHPPSQKKQRDKPNSHRDNGKLNITALCSGQTAHQPVGYRRKLIGGISNQFDKRCRRGKKRTDNYTRQD